MERATRVRGLRMTENDSNDEPIVSPVKQVPACPICGRDLYFDLRLIAKNGTKFLELRCPKHGGFPRGWKRKFTADVKAVIKQQHGR